MEKAGDDAAAKFISALIKSLQTLCHGYLDFQTGIEIIGHINLSVDKGNSLDYVLKEKVCKNAENSTLFISNTFHAEPKPDQEVAGKQGQTGHQAVQNSQVSDREGSTKVSSAISSISSALTGIRDRRQENSGAKDNDSSYSHHRAVKRKTSSDQSGDVCPPKIHSHHDGLHLSSDSAYHPNSSSPIDSKLGLQELQAAESEGSETMLPQTANVTDSGDLGVNLAGSVLEPVDSQSNTDLPERDEDSDGDLEVTFIKEEYVEGDRSACEFDNSGQQYAGGPHDRNAEGLADPSVFPVSLHSGSASSTYVPSAPNSGAMGQQYAGAVPSQPQPGPSGTRGSFRYRAFAQALAARHGSLSAGALTGPRLAALRQAASGAWTGARRSKFHECPHCHSKFMSALELDGHVCDFTKRAQHICNVCGKGITRKDDYEDHMNRHRNIRAHGCPHCGLRFTFKNNLRKHMRTGVCYKNKKLVL